MSNSDGELTEENQVRGALPQSAPGGVVRLGYERPRVRVWAGIECLRRWEHLGARLPTSAQANVKALADATIIDPALAAKIKSLLADPAVVKVMAEQKDLDLDDNAKL